MTLSANEIGLLISDQTAPEFDPIATEDRGFEALDLVRYPATAAIDLITTVADSVTFGAYDLETEDATSWVDRNLGTDLNEFYEQNSEIVELGSFVGGMILPGMAALKMAKAGIAAGKGQLIPNYMKNLERYNKLNTIKSQRAIKQVGVDSEAYRQSMKSLKLGTITEGAAEAVIFETGFALAMNEHAYLEDNYGPTDFAIGAVLGSAIGPIKWMIESKNMRKLAEESMASQLATTAGVAPAATAAMTQGHTIGGMAYLYKGVDDIDTAGMSKQVIDELPQRKEMLGKGLKDTIASISEDTLNVGSKFEDLKTNPVLADQITQNLDFPIDLRFNASPNQRLARQAVKQPTSYLGAKKFREFSTADSYAAHAAETTFDEMQGRVEAINAKVLSSLVGHSKKPNAPREMPAGVVIGTENVNGALYTKIEIPDSKFLKGKTGAQFKNWLEDFAAGEEGGKRVVLSSRDGHIIGMHTDELKKAQMDVPGTVDLLKAKGSKNITPAMLKENEGFNSPLHNTFGVSLPHFDDIILPSDNAIISLPASADPAAMARVNPKANAFTLKDMTYNPLKEDTQTIDAGFLQVRYTISGKNSQITKLGLDAENLYHVEAAFLHASRNQELKEPLEYTLSGQKYTSDRLDLLENMLLKRKADAAEKLFANGNSDEQVALYINMNLPDIQRLKAAKFNVAEAKAGGIKVSMYGNTAPEVIAQAKPISIIGKHRTYAEIEEMRLSTQLDRQYMMDTHTAIIRDNMAVSGLTQVQELFDLTVGSSAFAALRDNVERLITNASAAATRFTSRDQQLRYLGELGDHITHMGTNLVTKTTDMMKGITKRTIDAATALAENKAAIIQFEQVRRVIQANVDDVLVIDRQAGRILKKVATSKASKGEKVYATYLKEDGGAEIELMPETLEFLDVITKETRDVYKYINLLRKNDNLPPLPDKGMWLPYESIDDKFIAFKRPKDPTEQMQVITANDERVFAAEIDALKRDPDVMSRYDIVTRDQIDLWNDLLDVSALNPLRKADSSMKKAGIAVHRAAPDASGIDNLYGQIQRNLWNLNRLMIKQAAPDVFSSLDSATAIANRNSKSSKGTLNQLIRKNVPTSDVIRSTLLNTSLLNSTSSPIFSRANDVVTASINQSARVLNDAIETIRKESNFTAADFAELSRKLEQQGIPNPFKNLDEYLRARKASKSVDIAQEKVAAANGIVATLNLRLMDASHAILTVLSAPVVMSGMMKEKNIPMREFYETAKWMAKGGEDYKRIIGEANKLGYVKAIVSEYSDLVGHLHTHEGAFAKKFKNTVEFLSKPSDGAERITREFAYALAWRAAEAKGITDHALKRSYASSFTIRAMGNYNSRQRPTVFQGALGNIIGLYQTFMLSMAQNMYRYVENADWKALSTLVGAQGATFGLESLPFYGEFNRYMGAYVAEDGHDITQAVYDGLGNDADHSRSLAEFVLFGAPSAMFQAGFYTRGELNPRTPFGFEEGFTFKPPVIDNAVRIAQFAGNLVENVGKSVGNSGVSGDMFNAMGQAVAAQHVWRPAARITEAFMGESFDSKGELLGTHELMSLPTITRLLASRPLKEDALKRLRYNATYYDQTNRSQRQGYIKELRRLAATGNMYSTGALEELNDKYLKEGGSPQGWLDIQKRVMTEADTPLAERLAEEHSKNAAYVGILEGY